jgi:hypothetical protein
MQSHNISGRRTSFVLRIWWEEGDSGPVWRGWTQHAASGESCYFETLVEMLEFVQKFVGNLNMQEESCVE